MTINNLTDYLRDPLTKDPFEVNVSRSLRDELFFSEIEGTREIRDELERQTYLSPIDEVRVGYMWHNSLQQIQRMNYGT
jgi:hypothetical protein